MPEIQLGTPFDWNDPNLTFTDSTPAPSGDQTIGVRPIMSELIVQEDGTGFIKIQEPTTVQSNPSDLA
jgi:hypothetical protein